MIAVVPNPEASRLPRGAAKNTDAGGAQDGNRCGGTLKLHFPRGGSAIPLNSQAWESLDSRSRLEAPALRKTLSTCFLSSVPVLLRGSANHHPE